MAKVTGPFGGFHATQQIGKTYVFFLWKGLNVVRTWLIPNNPNTGAQQTVRGWFTALVTYWHNGLFNAADFEAWERAAGAVKGKPQSGFNRFIGIFMAIYQAGLTPSIFDTYINTSTAHAAFSCQANAPSGGPLDSYPMLWGTSPTSLWRTQAGAFMAGVVTWGPFNTGFGAGTKIYFKFRDVPAAIIGESGIYTETLT